LPTHRTEVSDGQPAARTPLSPPPKALMTTVASTAGPGRR
jgi:hypothetical protein